jgi:DNA gyrase/topoisomerase IV subunit A
MVPLHQLPDDQNTSVNSLTGLPRSEKLAGALVLPHPPEGEEPPETYLTLATRGGRIKRITLEDFSMASRGAVTAMGVEDGDELAWVTLTSGQDDVLLATRQGKAIRFSENDVRPMGLSAAGVLAVKFGKDDGIVGMGIAHDDEFAVLITEKGYAKRSAIKSFPTQKRYGGGVQATKLTNRTGRVAAVALASERQDVVLVTEKGRVTKLPLKAIHPLGRAASGYMSRKDNKDSYVDPAKHGPPTMLTVLAGTKAAAKAARAQTTKAKTPAKKTTTKKRTTKAKKTASGSRSTTRKKTTEKGTPTQMPLPMKSAPSKSGGKSTTRKKKTVRSVPKS